MGFRIMSVFADGLCVGAGRIHGLGVKEQHWGNGHRGAHIPRLQVKGEQ